MSLATLAGVLRGASGLSELLSEFVGERSILEIFACVESLEKFGDRRTALHPSGGIEIIVRRLLLAYSLFSPVVHLRALPSTVLSSRAESRIHIDPTRLIEI